MKKKLLTIALLNACIINSANVTKYNKVKRQTKLQINTKKIQDKQKTNSGNKIPFSWTKDNITIDSIEIIAKKDGKDGIRAKAYFNGAIVGSGNMKKTDKTCNIYPATATKSEDKKSKKPKNKTPLLAISISIDGKTSGEELQKIISTNKPDATKISITAVDVTIPATTPKTSTSDLKSVTGNPDKKMIHQLKK